MAVKKSAVQTIYHAHDGPVSMYDIDARHALRFGDEWSVTPWAQDGKPAKPVAEISAEWQDLKPSERIALAMKLGEERKGLTAAKADEVISAEVDRRFANPEPPVTEIDPRRADMPGPYEVARQTAQSAGVTHDDMDDDHVARQAPPRPEVDRRRVEAERQYPAADRPNPSPQPNRDQSSEAQRQRIEAGNVASRERVRQAAEADRKAKGE